MEKGRLEAFSDGVIAIIITIMVLELKIPHGDQLQDLKPLIPVFMSYVLSFLYVGIYWNNHHHMFQAVSKIDGSVLWVNLLLLFWLSVIPFVTAWMGENHFTPWPVFLYGFVLLMNSISYGVLILRLSKIQGPGSILAKAIGKDKKGKVSTILYIVGLGLAFYEPIISLAFYCMVAFIWLIPDSRIEKVFSQRQET